VLENMVELVGIEPTTSSLRKMASANLPQYPCGFPSRSRSKTVQWGPFSGLPGELPQQFFRLIYMAAGSFAEANPLRGRPRQRELPANARVVSKRRKMLRNPHDQAADRRMPRPGTCAHARERGRHEASHVVWSRGSMFEYDRATTYQRPLRARCPDASFSLGPARSWILPGGTARTLRRAA
jgi:hypothetical protein